jgi:hypothetical protein
VIRRYQGDFFRERGARVTMAERRVLNAVAACRTAALGGHLEVCDRCGHDQPVYNSCRNRHCPKCQAAARVEWLEAQRKDLLPVEYFHVVFTLPESLAPLVFQNKWLLYDLLFRAASETLLEVAATPRYLGAKIGFLAVLHTWGQNLMHHPHLHCVVPGGGLSPDHSRWILCRPGFFLPVRVLSRLFRGKFLAYLRAAYRAGELNFRGELQALGTASGFEQLIAKAFQTDWVVHAKPPFGGPEQVLKYLARYTHRVAISNDRLLDISNGQVTFRWKDYAGGSRIRTMTVSAVEFLRRFLLHVLPRGFVRIRHYGLLANRCRVEMLALSHRLLDPSQCGTVPGLRDDRPAESAKTALSADSIRRCAHCQAGHMQITESWPRPSRIPQLNEWLFDSS